MKLLIDYINEKLNLNDLKKRSNFDIHIFNMMSKLMRQYERVTVDKITEYLYDLDDIMFEYENVIKNIQNALNKYRNLEFIQVNEQDDLWWDIVDWTNKNGEPDGYVLLTPDKWEPHVEVGLYEGEEIVEVDINFDGSGDKFIAIKK